MRRNSSERLRSPFKENRNHAQRQPNRKAFAKELSRQLKIHGDTNKAKLAREVNPQGGRSLVTNLNCWLSGKRAPRRGGARDFMSKLEIRYHLPKDYFRTILFPPSHTEKVVAAFDPSQQHFVRWHLPSNFDRLPLCQRRNIIRWIKANVLAGATDYGAYVQASQRQHYQLWFPKLHDVPTQHYLIGRTNSDGTEPTASRRITRHEHFNAPKQLVNEMAELVRFKRSVIAPEGSLRASRWSVDSAFLRVRLFARIFGALVASPTSEIKGYGADRSHLTLALFVFPSFWDWLLNWLYQRRGFFNPSDNTLLDTAISLLQPKTGWIQQSPMLGHHLSPIKGLVTARAIRDAKRDWPAACEKANCHLRARSYELRKIAIPHRNTFLPIAEILKSDEPLREYRKISDEILRLLPAACDHPVAAAEHVRAYLLIRLGMHLGLRSKNLRQLLFCPKGKVPRSDKVLRDLRRGELRWLEREKVWEVYLPSRAFKNWQSKFFKNMPLQITLPDACGLYHWIDVYLRRHRRVLLGNHIDPGTLFVRTLTPAKDSPELGAATMNHLWRNTIIHFGIYNPYTKRGAIEGLLPHGPHAIRDVIATHIIKQTSSYELAAYALHCTPQVIEGHYCGIVAAGKAALATKVMNKVWEPTLPQRKSKAP